MSRALKRPNRRQSNPLKRRSAKGSDVTKAATEVLNFGVSFEIEPMEARSAGSLPADHGWQYEPKWDGFRCLAFKDGSNVDLRAKSRKALSRYFPEVVQYLSRLQVERFVIDGELVIELNGKLSFDALQARLHPAESRIRKLSLETPARLVAFDMLLNPEGTPILDESLLERRAALEDFAQNAASGDHLILSPFTRDLAEANLWLSSSGGDTDGVVCKRLDGPYKPGERAMIKVKRLRTADCVVGASDTRAIANLSALCCSAFTMSRASLTMSASHRLSQTRKSLR